MASDRPYRKARSKQYIIDELKKFAGTQFDPQVVEQAVRLLEIRGINKASIAPVESIFALKSKEAQLTVLQNI